MHNGLNFISLSPYALEKPWEFGNVQVTANSLARSNVFNLFLIFLDFMLVAIFDMKSLNISRW